MRIFTGLIFTIFGVMILIGEIKKKIKYKSTAKGKVINIITQTTKKSSGKDKKFLYPVFEYKVLGKIYTEKSIIGYGPKYCKYNVGQEVDIHCDSNNPKMFYVKGEKTNLSASLLSIAMGLFILFA